MYRRRLSLLAALLFAFTFAFSACNPASSGGASSAKAMVYPGTKETGSVTTNLRTEPSTLFSTLANDVEAGNVLKHLLDTLVVVGPDEKIIPAAADRWDYDEKTYTYTFHLNKNSVWSNGAPVTAQDFVYGWQCLLDPKFAAPTAYAAFIVKNGEEINTGKLPPSALGVKAVDDYTFQVELRGPTAYALSQFTNPVFAPLNEKAYKDIVAKKGETAYGTSVDTVVTNGPYKLTKWEHENLLTVEKDTGYKGSAKVAIEKIHFRMISDSNTALNEFRAGNMDYLPVLEGSQAALLKNEGVKVQNLNTASMRYLDYNFKWPGLDNPNVRKALAMSIDLEALCKNVLKNSSQPSYNFVPAAITESVSGKPFTQRVGPQFKFDVAKAKELLQLGLTQKLMSAADLKLELVVDDNDVSKNVGAYLQEQWKKNLGIEVKVNAMPKKSRLDKLYTKDFCLVFDSWYPDYNDPFNFLEAYLSNNANNASTFVDKEYDDTLIAAAKENDPEKRYAVLAQAEKFLVGRDMAPGPLYTEFNDYVITEKLQNFKPTAFQTTLRFATLKQ